MTEPVSRAIGTIRRFRNRSTSLPSSRRDDEAALDELRRREALLHQALAQPVAARRRVAELQRVDGVGRQAALVQQVLADARAGGRDRAARGNSAAATSWILSSASRSAALSRAPSLGSISGIGMPKRCASCRTASWKPTFSCSSMNLKTSPPTPQPKQWKKPAVAIDVERRRLLAVERAEALVAGAGLAQRHVVRDDGDDVGRRADFVDEGLGE